MLRPSRPMMRPFSSSDLSSTTDTVVSTACPPATRCMQVARMLRARRSASWRVSSSTWRISRALSWRSSSSSSRRRICFACPALRPDTRSSSRTCSRLASLSRAAPSSMLRALSAEHALALVELLQACVERVSFARSRSSRRASSSRRARSSASRSSRRRPPARALSPRRAVGAGPGRTLGIGLAVAGRARRRRTPCPATAGPRSRRASRTTSRGHPRGYRGRQQNLHFAVSSPGSGRAPFSSSGGLLGAARTQGLLLRARASGARGTSVSSEGSSLACAGMVVDRCVIRCKQAKKCQFRCLAAAIGPPAPGYPRIAALAQHLGKRCAHAARRAPWARTAS